MLEILIGLPVILIGFWVLAMICIHFTKVIYPILYILMLGFCSYSVGEILLEKMR